MEAARSRARTRVERCVIRNRFLEAIRSSEEGRPPPVPALADLARRWRRSSRGAGRNSGGGGGVLWEVDRARGPPHRSFLRVCYEALPLEQTEALLRLLLEDDPGLLERRGGAGGGETLLHAAAADPGAPVEVLRLVATRRSAAMRNWGETPLHAVCRTRRRPGPAAEMLVSVNPAALKAKDRMGRLPVHWACTPWARQFDPSTVSMLVQADPSALKVCDGVGDLPLHGACRNLARREGGEDALDAVRRMVEAYPGALLRRDRGGCTPLMIAARAGGAAGPDAVRVLAEAAPIALLVRDDEGRAPLHAALNWRRGSFDPDAVHALIDANPSTLRMTDGRGILPLQLACLLDGGDGGPHVLGLIRRMIETYPEALLATDGCGSTPVGAAVRVGLGSTAVRALAEANPSALCTRDRWGLTPLHSALSWHDPFDPATIHVLLDANPSVLTMSDYDGRLPLHVACLLREGRLKRGDGARVLGVIRRMIEIHPDALQLPDYEGRTPVATAVAHGGPIADMPEVVALVVGMVERGGAASVRGVNRFLRAFPCQEIVSALVEAWPCFLCYPPCAIDVEEPAMRESDAVVRALVEVLLHETTAGAVPGAIRQRVRGLVAGQPDGRSVTRAVQDLFGGDEERTFLESQEKVQDMVAGVYRMNKAGRAPGGGAPEAVSPARQILTLAAAADSPSCLFLHLRDAGCRCLFPLAGVGGPLPVG
jgi:ankyrin repeat protein